MARVFLSYDREDADRARPLAAALERAGHKVWWDQHIRGGSQYSKVIEQALADAEAVVVLWSARSIDSAWVRDEAAAGRDSGRLVPVTLGASEPPLGFRQYQTIDLGGWAGRGKPANFPILLDAINALSTGQGASDPSAVNRLPAQRGSDRIPNQGRLLVAGALLILLLASAALVLWRPWSGTHGPPAVAILAEDGEPRSVELARDLFIKLGSLQTVRSDSFQLMEAGQAGAKQADLILEVGGLARGGQAEANLALFASRGRSLLWSKQFVRPAGEDAELRHQLSLTAGQTLECALQAMSAEREQLKNPVMKLYLNGCSALEDLALGDLRPVVPIFLEVTRQAPRFQGGWTKLLQAEILTLLSGRGDASLPQSLAAHIAEARRINPNLPMAYLAEAELVSPFAYGRRLDLTDLAIRHSPNRPEPFMARAYYLGLVGRMNEAVEDAKRGTELNPLSPAAQVNYTSALAHAGEIDLAKQELERAEQSWPASRVVANAIFRFNLRYGDPRAAVGVAQGAPLWTRGLIEAFLKARLNPNRANVDAAISEAMALERKDPRAIGIAIYTLGAFGREKEVLPLILRRRPKPGDGRIGEYLFGPALRPLRHDPRFMQLSRRLRLVDYWQSSGKWPDFCFEPDLPYDCKTEAAKVSA